MVQKQKNFNELLKIGEDGEREIAIYLLEKYNISILPLYQFNNEKTPLLFSLNKSLILPDLTCFKKGDVYFVEVKTKSQWVRFNNNIETGLDARLYLQYDEVQKNTNLNIYIIFNHKKENPQGYYTTFLNKYTRFWDGKVKEKQVYSAMYFYNINILKEI